MNWKKKFYSVFALTMLSAVVACSSSRVQEEEVGFTDEEFTPYDMVGEGNSLDDAFATEADSNEYSSTADINSPYVTEDDYNAAYASKPVVSENVAPYRNSKAVKVRLNPFQSSGYLMNAFYFVRDNSENYSTVSKKLYGRADKATLIAGWNNNQRLNVGDVIYYNSATRPEDATHMMPFAQDFNVRMQQYVVRPGDTLSKIAQSKYGNLMIWKELSGLNPQLESPDLIYPGQELLMQPANVDTQSVIAQLKKQAQEIARQKDTVEDEQEEASAVAVAPRNNEDVSIDEMLPPEGQNFDEVKPVDAISRFKNGETPSEDTDEALTPPPVAKENELAKADNKKAAEPSATKEKLKNREKASVASGTPSDSKKQQSKIMLIIGAALLLISAFLFWKRSKAKA